MAKQNKEKHSNSSKFEKYKPLMVDKPTRKDYEHLGRVILSDVRGQIERKVGHVKERLLSVFERNKKA